MNRREFIQSVASTLGLLASPKFIFDYGANLYKPNYDIFEIQNTMLFKDVLAQIIHNFYLNINPSSQFIITQL